MKIKIRGEKIGSLTSYNSTIELNDIKIGDNIEFSFGRTKSSVNYRGGNAILIDQPRFLNPLCVFSLFSLTACLIISPDTVIITSLMLLPAIFCLGIIFYYFLFRPSRFLRIREI